MNIFFFSVVRNEGDKVTIAPIGKYFGLFSTRQSQHWLNSKSNSEACERNNKPLRGQLLSARGLVIIFFLVRAVFSDAQSFVAGDAPTYVNGQLIVEETVLHHVSDHKVTVLMWVVVYFPIAFVIHPDCFACRLIVLSLEVITFSGIANIYFFVSSSIFSRTLQTDLKYLKARYTTLAWNLET